MGRAGTAGSAGSARTAGDGWGRLGRLGLLGGWVRSRDVQGRCTVCFFLVQSCGRHDVSRGGCSQVNVHKAGAPQTMWGVDFCASIFLVVGECALMSGVPGTDHAGDKGRGWALRSGAPLVSRQGGWGGGRARVGWGVVVSHR